MMTANGIPRVSTRQQRNVLRVSLASTVKTTSPADGPKPPGNMGNLKRETKGLAAKLSKKGIIMVGFRESQKSILTKEEI
jgi:hypothetical protein